MIGQDSLESILTSIKSNKENDYKFTYSLEVCFPHYPFILPPQEGDERTKSIYKAVKVVSKDCDSGDARKALLMMSTEQMKSTLKFLSTEDKSFLELLFYSCKSGDNSLLLYAINNKKDNSSNPRPPFDVLGLLAVMSELFPDDLKKMTKIDSYDKKPLTILIKDEKEKDLVAEIIAKYAAFFEELSFLSKIGQDDSTSTTTTFSTRDILLTLLGGDEELLKDSKNFIPLIPKMNMIHANSLIPSTDLTGVQLSALWKKNRPWTQKLLRQPISNYPNAYQYLVIDKGNDEEIKKFLNEVRLDDEPFFKECCLAGKLSLMQRHFYLNDGKLMEIFGIDVCKQMLSYEANPKIIIRNLFNDHSKTLETGLLYSEKSDLLFLDGIDNGVLFERLLDKYANEQFQKLNITEVSLVGCNINYETLKRLFDTFPKLTTLTIQQSDLKNFRESFGHLLLGIKLGSQKPFTIKFSDIPNGQDGHKFVITQGSRKDVKKQLLK